MCSSIPSGDEVLQPARRHDLDIMRVILCNSVMLVHVLGLLIPWYGSRRIVLSSFLAFAGSIVRVAVPGFVFLSGFFVLYNRKSFNARQFWQSRIRSIVPSYLLFSCIYILAYYRDQTLQQWADHILRGTACYHLYYIIVILQLFGITPLLVKAMQKHRQATLLGAAIVSASFTVINTLTYPLLATYYWFPPYLVYYAYGMFVATGNETPWSPRTLLICTLLFLPANTAYSTGAHLAAYAALKPLPNPYYSFLLSALEYTKNILGMDILRQLCSQAPTFLQNRLQSEPHNFASRMPAAFFTCVQDKQLILHLRRWTDFAASHSYEVYLAHPLLLSVMQRLTGNRPYVLLLIFIPGMWLLTSLYCRLRRILTEPQRM